ncbi:MAG: WbqC family protein [Burkholderiaceae bacterium]|nr:WbqC family protein [Burkholderiaceae bacterium]
MKAAIMQPYFFPYIGYFQLIAAADLFIVYDNIKYTKKGWINRNRMLQDGKDKLFSLPLRKGSDFLDVRDRFLAADFDRGKLLATLRAAYARAPYFSQAFPLIERCIGFEGSNLFDYLCHALTNTCAFLGIETEIRISSQIDIDHTLTSQNKVLALCEAVGADSYVNAIGGVELYSKQDFSNKGIALQFIRTRPFEYAQFGGEFIPMLSIIDVLMFNSRETIRQNLLNNYDLI